jgi:hypothetical protein
VVAPLLLVIALGAIAVAGYWMKLPAEAVKVSCVDPLAGCVFSHRGTPVKVRFSKPPAPLEAFELNVHATGAKRVSAEFQMVGMDMGFNRYSLQPAAGGVLTAKAALPICVSGRRDWVLYLDIDGTRYAMPFSTR